MVAREVEPEVELSLAGHNLDRDEKQRSRAPE
jgi:hypothetical protein